MAGVSRTPSAQKQIDEIVDYLAEESESAAERFVEVLAELSELLAAFPEMGTPRDDLDPGLRMLTMQRFSYLLYYRFENGLVRITGVIHSSRAPSARLPDRDA